MTKETHPTPWRHYPFDEPGFVLGQRLAATHYTFGGVHKNVTAVTLIPGERYELWPGGTLVNAYGTVLGYLDVAEMPSPLPELHADPQYEVPDA
jgi:hypothetical protein